MAAWTPPFRCGTPASSNPISTLDSVPAGMRSVKSPRWPMRNTRSAILDRAIAEGHVESADYRGAEIVSAVPLRHKHGGQRAGIVPRFPAEHFESKVTARLTHPILWSIAQTASTASILGSIPFGTIAPLGGKTQPLA